MRSKTSVFLAATVIAVMTALGSGAEARQVSPTEEHAGNPWAGEYTEGAAVGASLTHPAGWSVERERQTFDGTYGFTLWEPESGAADHDHGGTPVVRVARAFDLRPAGISAAVREELAAYPDLSLRRSIVSVGAAGHRGVAVGPIPGSTPSTEVYVPVDDRVYLITVYASRPGEEDLDARDRELLSDLRFYQPSRQVESLGLPNGESAATYYGGEEEEIKREEAAFRADVADDPALFSTRASGTHYGEKRIYEGCWLAGSRYYFRVQHGLRANGNPGDDIPKGYSIVGEPNYWGEYTHGSLDYGRCKEPYYTNDKFAVDYPLNRGDAIFSPFKRGTVTFAGRNKSHKDYGIFVTIRAGNGKYVSMSAHLSELARGIKRGKVVTRGDIIGRAGRTGGGKIPVGQVHLHQAFYRNPSFTPDHAPYGGRGLQVLYFHYFRGEGGVHKLGWSHTRDQSFKGDSISH